MLLRRIEKQVYDIITTYVTGIGGGTEMRMENIFLMPVLGISTWLIVSIVIIVVLAAALVALTIYGRKLQARQESSQRELENAAQSVAMLVIDKKRMKLSQAGLPQIVIDQTPKYMRNRKVPIVKAKVGPRIMPLICDEKIFELIPTKKEVRAMVSGIYIMSVKGLHTNLEQHQKKLKFSQKMRNKLDEMRSGNEAAASETLGKKKPKK